MESRTPWGLAVALALSLPAVALVTSADAARPVDGFWASGTSQSHTTVHSSLARSTCRNERVAWAGETVLMREVRTRDGQAAALRRTVVARKALIRCEAALRAPAPEPVSPLVPTPAAAPAGGSGAPAPASPAQGVQIPGVVTAPPVVPTEASVTVNGSGDGVTVSASGAITLVGNALTPAPPGSTYRLSLRTPIKTPGRPPVGCQRGDDSPDFSSATGSFTLPASALAPFCVGTAQGTLWVGPPDAILGDDGVVNLAKVEFTIAAP
jgi:hypothetical protein